MERRTADFNIRDALRAPNFTPRTKDAPALVALLAGDEEAARHDAARALGRMEPAAAFLLAEADAAVPPLRGRLCRVVGRLAEQGVAEAEAFLLSRLSDPDGPTRRAAIMALGLLQGSAIEEALLQAWQREDRPENRRALAASLGKVGGAGAISILRAVGTDDLELRRLVDRALLMLERTQARAVPARLRLDLFLSHKIPIICRCRAGLEDLLAEEIRPWAGSARAIGPGVVTLALHGPPEKLFVARTLLHLAFPLPMEGPVSAGPEGLAEALARTLVAPAATAIFDTFTEGPPRFRLSFAGGGHRRAVTWRCAQLVSERSAQLRNDPTDSLWEAVVHDGARGPRLELRPHRPPDPRFSYRQEAVPAASHPTLAAALARVAGVVPEDRVWDPFVGSGLELVERALFGPYQTLCGTDLDPAALAAARANLAAARCERVHLTLADACTFDPGAPSLILTNPPMGRRVQRDGALGALLDRFVDHAAVVLRPGGRLVWLSPLPERTATRLREAGLVLAYQRTVDMGGFTAQIQIARKGQGGAR